jgi:hypothetical protein
MTEVRGQKTDDKRQMAEFRGQRLECIADSSTLAAIG